MELKEIKERKKKLESDIANLLIKFTNDTGVNLKDIEIIVVDAGSYSQPSKSLLGEVKVIAEIL